MSTDTSFKQFQDCLNAEIKRFTGLGDGLKVIKTQPFSEDEENKLWNLGFLGDSLARVRSETMDFLMGKNFSLRSGREHRNLKFSLLTLKSGNEKKPEN